MTALIACVASDAQGRVLLLYRNTPNRQQWELPGSAIAVGEDVYAAAQRTMREELGVEILVNDHLGTCQYAERHREYTCTWLGVVIRKGRPRINKPWDHQTFAYHYPDTLNLMRDQLSPSAQQYLDTYHPLGSIGSAGW